MNIKEVSVPIQKDFIKGTLTLMPESPALVIFAHGSGSSRFSPRNKFVAETLNIANISTLLFDLLTEKEEVIDQQTREFRFDIPMLAQRLIKVTQWCRSNQETSRFPYGYFGSSTGAAAALIAAAQIPDEIKAVVSRGGRPDLADNYLPNVLAPTLLIVGQLDHEVIKLNQQALEKMNCRKDLYIVPAATHLFEEKGALDLVARLARDWFIKYLV